LLSHYEIRTAFITMGKRLSSGSAARSPVVIGRTVVNKRHQVPHQCWNCQATTQLSSQSGRWVYRPGLRTAVVTRKQSYGTYLGAGALLSALLRPLCGITPSAAKAMLRLAVSALLFACSFDPFRTILVTTAYNAQNY
jgi:hypothetical protein